MMPNKALIVNEMHESILPMLEKIGVTGIYKPYITRSEILDSIGEFKGIIIRSKFRLDSDFFRKAVSLKYIARAGAGLDQIDLEEVEKRGIKIFNAPEGNRDSLGEHTLGLLLSLMHNITKSDREVKSGNWDRFGNRGVELKDKTVGIIGFGNMGSSFAEKLSGFNCRIVVYDIKKNLTVPPYVQKVGLDELKEQSDIVSLHVPLTADTLNMVNYEWLSSCSKKIWIINTSRGGVLNQKDLLTCLESGKVRGAALDVLENENIQSLTEDQKSIFDKLANRNNTILTPHVGGWSEESYVRINEVLVDKINNFLLQIG